MDKRRCDRRRKWTSTVPWPTHKATVVVLVILRERKAVHKRFDDDEIEGIIAWTGGRRRRLLFHVNSFTGISKLHVGHGAEPYVQYSEYTPVEYRSTRQSRDHH